MITESDGGRRRATTLPYNNNNNKHNNNTRARAASGQRGSSRDEVVGRAAAACRLPRRLAAQGSSTELCAGTGEWMRRELTREKISTRLFSRLKIETKRALLVFAASENLWSVRTMWLNGAA